MRWFFNFRLVVAKWDGRENFLIKMKTGKQPPDLI